VETDAKCKKMENWISKPHGFAKDRFADVHNEILFDRSVTAQLYCPKKVQLTAYSTPTLVAVDANGEVCGGDPRPYRYLPSKKDVLEHAAGVVEMIGQDIPFDVATRDALYCFQNGRARLGGMPAEPTGEFSSVVVYRHRPPQSRAEFETECFQTDAVNA
jgi:hypothetical protein